MTCLTILQVLTRHRVISFMSKTPTVRLMKPWTTCNTLGTNTHQLLELVPTHRHQCKKFSPSRSLTLNQAWTRASRACTQSHHRIRWCHRLQQAIKLAITHNRAHILLRVRSLCSHLLQSIQTYHLSRSILQSTSQASHHSTNSRCRAVNHPANELWNQWLTMIAAQMSAVEVVAAFALVRLTIVAWRLQAFLRAWPVAKMASKWRARNTPKEHTTSRVIVSQASRMLPSLTLSTPTRIPVDQAPSAAAT